MEAFIKKQEYNYIQQCLTDLNNAFRNSVDYRMMDANKSYIQDKIFRHLPHLSAEEKAILDISHVTDSSSINQFLNELNDYVYEMESITNAQISKIFKKEKKLKLPDATVQDSKKVYLGWIDYSIKKLLIVYPMDHKFIGMACRISDVQAKNKNVCALCNHIGPSTEVAFVSPICKTRDSYKSIGFQICLDSAKCNERIVSVERLETMLKNVNNIK